MTYKVMKPILCKKKVMKPIKFKWHNIIKLSKIQMYLIYIYYYKL